MTKAQKTKWLKALRSGEYKQGKSLLHNDVENTYCCLGVARACGLTRRIRGDDSGASFELVSTNFLSMDVQDKLAGMNDSGKHSFASIADYIEENL